VIIGRPEAAAEVHVLEWNPGVAQLDGDGGQCGGGALQRFRGRNLRADVHVHADESQSRQRATLPVDRDGLRQGDTELVRLESGGDVRMAARVDVGVDAQRHARLPLLAAGDGRDAIELAGRLGIDRADVARDREFELGARLAHAGEHHLARREAGAQRDLDLAAGVRVGAAAERAQQPCDGERRVGLQRVVDGMRIAVERAIDGRVRLPDGARTVDVERRANAIDDGADADAVAGQAARRRLER
jgi:hypothetical protein